MSAAVRPFLSRAMREEAGPRREILLIAVVAMVLAALSAPFAVTLAAREREPNSVYADRRARLVAQLNAPILLFGYTGRENSSPSYVFLQEPNFYHLTGHNDES